MIDVDFEVRRGEVCGLIGENGSGKTTLISIISGLMKPDSGNMQIHGKSYNPNSVLDGQNNKIKGFTADEIVLPCHRFTNIEDWHIKTKRVKIKKENEGREVEATPVIEETGELAAPVEPAPTPETVPAE